MTPRKQLCLILCFFTFLLFAMSEVGFVGAQEPDLQKSQTSASWPGAPNQYSWDGSWTPLPSDFPLPGILDSIYFDGHNVEGSPSPILPPGEWDWQVIHLLANWRGFLSSLGNFERLEHNETLHYGWRLIRNVPEGVAATAVLQYFHGSSGMDILDLGPEGSFASAGNPLYGDPVNFSDGPDIFRYKTGHSAACRLGSSFTGISRDNDLVVIGGSDPLPAGSYDIVTTGIHTGPGRDLVFVNNWERAAVDLGNGSDGRTDSIDPYDGGDIIVIGGNARDFRVFGGNGDDLFVWLIDEVNQVPGTWLGPNFFGGGSWGDALWSDAGVDRLILGIPAQTTIVSTPGACVPGTLLVMIESGYTPVIDTPTEQSQYARYYIKAPDGPLGQRTMTVQYRSSDDTINSAYFYLTDIEELQLGVGSDALVYALDDINGTATLQPALPVKSDIPSRTQFENLIDTFPTASIFSDGFESGNTTAWN